ncbi:MAG: NADH:flavin oxidoreductase [Planctomycetes bacterium]|nr:NADH:flavin oxidoreductase [Planctomycetota bacterium]
MSELYPKIAQLKTVEALRGRLDELGLELPVDNEIESSADGSPMAQPIAIGRHQVANRWCIHPMEGWDANHDGSPTKLTLRRWRNFGLSGAKFIWGGEAAAVQPDGRANPNQTLAIPENLGGLKQLLNALLDAHVESFGDTEGLFVGLQLTHSGRFCRPNSKELEPRIAYHHPLLDEKFGIDPADASVIWTDADLERLIDNYVVAAGLALQAGYQFVDIKSCHGYLLHEFLSARPREGKFGGDFEGRTRLLRTIVARIRDAYPALTVVVRLSVFDMPPFKTSREIGEPMDYARLLPYDLGFGINADDPMEADLDEPLQLIGELQKLGVAAINLSAGSPYYNPHMQRPAIFPPSDGYFPPEDPLVGVVRQIQAARHCQEAFPELPMVGSGYSYLQDYLPHVAQAVVRRGWINMVGLGRMVLSYPELPADSLAGREMRRKLVCRTFSDCTTAPRNGIVSGCFPLDSYYKSMPEAAKLRELKQDLK